MIFCDWLSIYQEHPLASCAVLNDGHVVGVDANGEIKWQASRKFEHKGSHDTVVRLSSDGHRVRLEGNIGRLGRPDNLFGHSVSECVRLANKLLASFSLPPFTASAGKLEAARTGADIPTGAIITRLDITENFATGSQAHAEKLTHWLTGQAIGRFKAKSYAERGVSWGEGSKYWYAKAYNKYQDIAKHRGDCSDQVLGYCQEHGIMRLEVSLKSRYLLQNGLRDLAAWFKHMKQEEKVFALFSTVLDRETVLVDSFAEIPGRLGEIAVTWSKGVDMWNRLPNSTRYRWRKKLLAYGVDIRQQSGVTPLPLRVEVIQVSPVAVPAWYELTRVA